MVGMDAPQAFASVLRSFSRIYPRESSFPFTDVSRDVFTDDSSDESSSSSSSAYSVDEHIRQLVLNLSSVSIEIQKQAAELIRILAKKIEENRQKIAKAGAVGPLIKLMSSPDPQIQESAVTAILNLSLCYDNKKLITHSGGITPLINALRTGTEAVKENAAAAIMYLSLIQENQNLIGEEGAIQPLVNLLKTGTPRGKDDACAALCVLGTLDVNKVRAVDAGIIKPLIELMKDLKSNMVIKSAWVLNMLMQVKRVRVMARKEGVEPVLTNLLKCGLKEVILAMAMFLQLWQDDIVLQHAPATSRADQKTAVEHDKLKDFSSKIMKSEGTSESVVYGTTPPSIFTSRNQINKTQHELNKEESGGMTMVSQFLEKNAYYVNVRKPSAMDIEIADLFFSHLDVEYLLHLFPDRIVIDTTRKIIKYNMSLVEIMGFTSKGRIFNVAVAMMAQDNAENYEWVLRCLKTLCESVRSKPTVIITDPEHGNMSDLSKVFPDAKHLISWVYIIDKIKSFWQDDTCTNSFCRKCIRLFSSRTEAEYKERLQKMSRKFSVMTTHLEEMWLLPSKEHIVVGEMMTKQYFDSITTYRNELTSAIAKHALDTSDDTLLELVKVITCLRADQIRSVRSSLEKSSVKEPTMLDKGTVGIGLATKDEWGKEVHGKGIWESNANNADPFSTLLQTMREIHEDGRLSEDQMNSICAIIKSEEKNLYGRGSNLFEHQRMENERIQSNKEQARMDNQNEEGESMSNTCKKSSVSSSSCGQFSCKKGRGGCLPESDSLSAIHQQRDAAELKVQDHSLPIDPLNFNWGENSDNFMLQFIISVWNIESDGHCGFRTMSFLLGKGQENFLEVRQAMVEELSDPSKLIMYENASQPKPIDIVIQDVGCVNNHGPTNRWLEMPIVGLAFATRYQVALVLLAWGASMTCLPMKASPSNDCPPTVVLAFALVGRRNHFVPILLAENAPLPPPPGEWLRFHDPSVNEWDAPFRDRIKSFQSYALKNNEPTLMY